MTEVQHLCCDRCDVDVVVNSRETTISDRGWARCHVGLDRFDFCPTCWRAMLELAAVKREP